MISTERRSDKVSLLLNSCGIDYTEKIRRGSIRPHGRVDYHLLYIARGECHAVLEDGEHTVGEGGLIFFFPGQRQEYFFEPNSGSISYYIHFTGRDAEEILRSLGFYGKNIFEAPKNRELVFHVLYALIGRLSDNGPVATVPKSHLAERKASRQLDNLRLFLIEPDTVLGA